MIRKHTALSALILCAVILAMIWLIIPDFSDKIPNRNGKKTRNITPLHEKLLDGLDLLSLVVSIVLMCATDQIPLVRILLWWLFSILTFGNIILSRLEYFHHLQNWIDLVTLVVFGVYLAWVEGFYIVDCVGVLAEKN